MPYIYQDKAAQAIAMNTNEEKILVESKEKRSPAERKKVFFFKVAAVLLPFVFLILVEVILRWSGYGMEYNLFQKVEDRPGHLVMSPEIGKKYFFHAENSRTGYQEVFKQYKGANTFRIFVLGASTGVGYPYLGNGSFHRWLQYGLNLTFPDKDIEVINLSLTAINSYTLLDFTDEVIEQRPDAVLIYAGHNEYYGALGVGASNSLGKYPSLVSLAVRSKNLRLVQLMLQTVTYFSGSGQSSPDISENLMKRMAEKQSIPLGSELYEQGIEQYRANMYEILAKFDDAGVSTYIATLFSNEKDLPPFISDTTDTKNAASSYFNLGKKAFTANEFKKSKTAFVKVKDLDLLRFRAPSKLNSVIDELSNAYSNVHKVDAYETLEKKSPQKIIGSELLLEHVHPNLRGYSLLAYSFYEALKSNREVAGEWNKALSYDDFYEKMPITVVDSLLGAYETMMLKEGWPFYEAIEDFDRNNRTEPEKIAGQLSVKQLTLNESRERLYNYYYKKKDYKNALKVAEAVNLAYPEDAEFYLKSAGLAMNLSDIPKARYLFDKALKLRPSSPLAKKIAINFIIADEFQTAQTYLTFALEKNPNDATLSQLKRSLGIVLSATDSMPTAKNSYEFLNIAQHYLLLGKANKAETYIDAVLKKFPKNSNALLLAKRLEK